MAILASAVSGAVERPNVLVLTAGAQGAGELSSAGHPGIKTPHLDGLRREGLDFLRMVGAPNATATRVQFLTGCHEFRSGVSHTLAGRNLPRPDRAMLPELLRQAGYRTALVGRWGLGEALPCRPEDRGFEEICIIGGEELGGLADRWGNGAVDPILRTTAGWVAKKGTALQAWTAEAARFLAARGADRQPFFLMVDVGAAIPPGITAARRNEALTTADGAVGEVLAELDRADLTASTMVVFTGMGGPPAEDSNSGLKGALGSTSEGGVRVPACIRWPEKIAPGGRCEALVGTTDWFATLLALCGLPAAPADGRDLAGWLVGKAAPPAPAMIFSHPGGWSGDDRPERHQSTGFAVRELGWLLAGLELFDLTHDPAQRVNLFEKRPEVGTRLLSAYGAWWAAMLPSLRQPIRIVVGDARQPVVHLTAADWWPSRETSGAVGAAELRPQAAARVVVENLAAGRPVAETAGLWKLAAAREGHYRVTLSLLPATAPQHEITRLGQLKAGKIHLRTGRKEIVMDIVKGATAVTLNLDLPAGDLDLETWFDGQLPGNKMLGALFAEIERTGERKLPEIDLDFRTAPKK